MVVDLVSRLPRTAQPWIALAGFYCPKTGLTGETVPGPFEPAPYSILIAFARISGTISHFFQPSVPFAHIGEDGPLGGSDIHAPSQANSRSTVCTVASISTEDWPKISLMSVQNRRRNLKTARQDVRVETGCT